MGKRRTESEGEERELKVVRKPSQTDEAVDLIRSRIIDLSVPPGSRIDERLLIEQFKLGRTPAREAINRLQAEGLVNIIPDRGGKYVRDLDVQEISQILMAHQVAESIVASMCDFDDSTLARDLRNIQGHYAKSVDERSYLHITELNQEFHLRLFQSIDNSFLFEFAQSLYRHFRRLLMMMYRLEARNPKIHSEQFDANVAEHWALIEMIEKGDRAALRQSLPAHAAQTHLRLAAFLDRRTRSAAVVDLQIRNPSKRK